MSPSTREVLIRLSEVTLLVLLIGLTTLARLAWGVRARDGVVVRRMAEFLVVLALFFGWSALVQWDHRWNLWPWADLSELMSLEWQWIPHGLLALPTAALLVTLIRTRR
jgi:hypothetical protein